MQDLDDSDHLKTVLSVGDDGDDDDNDDDLGVAADDDDDEDDNDVVDDDEEDAFLSHDLATHQLVATNSSTTIKKGRRKTHNNKRDNTGQLRKAPGAPKRFKSSYICFFMAKQTEIKAEIGEQASVAAISKRSAEMWKTLTPHQRAHWDDVALKDKQRFLVEKASYTGPWQVPWKRVKKDPAAPKRPMSAFLYFSLGRRTRIRTENPDMKNTEVSRILGEMWRNLSDEDRQPFVDQEKSEREKYKVVIAEWRENEAKAEAERKANVEHHMASLQHGDSSLPHSPSTVYADPFGHPTYAYGNPYPPYRTFLSAESDYRRPLWQETCAHLPLSVFTSDYQAPPGTFARLPVSKQPIVLAPNGQPRYPFPYTPMPHPPPPPPPPPPHPSRVEGLPPPAVVQHHPTVAVEYVDQHPPPHHPIPDAYPAVFHSVGAVDAGGGRDVAPGGEES